MFGRKLIGISEMTKVTRREFLKVSALGIGAVIINPIVPKIKALDEFPAGATLGRNCTGGIANLRMKPDANSEIVKILYEDSIVVWLREVIGNAPAGTINKRWVETPEGYLYSPAIQPVKNLPNVPVPSLPDSALGRGMWAEVTVPYVDIFIANPPPRSAWAQSVPRTRVYYGQVLWVDDVATDSNGQVLYRLNELYGNPGDIYWAAAEAFRPITAEEIAPISPDVENKRVIVDVAHQHLVCLENDREVFFCKVSTGRKFNASGEAVETPLTPTGAHPIWRKLISLHMAGGTAQEGWDTMGIGWTSLFVGDGVAIHSTFWHNNFGSPVSHGCVNCLPEDAKWVFRWTSPVITLDMGEKTVSMPGGTIVDVREVA
jgi:lipoprotein-anchoring transpeptidase ErfK/SrfK